MITETPLQLQEQLDAVDAILVLCTPQLKLRLQRVQQEVVDRWEELRLYTEQREEELKLTCQRYLFLNTVSTSKRSAGRLISNPTSHVFLSFLFQAQDYLLWCSQLIGAMAAEESISDVSGADIQLAQHQQLWAEMEARRETYQQALDMGEELLMQDRNNRKEVRMRRT